MPGGIPPPVLRQSFTIKQGPFNSLRFSWQRSGVQGTPVPVATGRVFLLDREYPSRITDLSPSVASFIAVSEPAANDEYVFDSAIVVQPGTRYWFYTNDQTTSLLLTSDGHQDLYADGDMYVPGGDRFVVFYWLGRDTDRVDANFVLRGRATSR